LDASVFGNIKRSGRGMLYIFIVYAIVKIENSVKNYIETSMNLDERKDILKGWVSIRKHYNEGAFLQFMEKKKELVKTVSCVLLGILLLVFALLLPKKGNRLYKLGLSLILGGGISNVGDRLLKGRVVDYFSINIGRLKRIVFNLADFAIFIGSFLLLLASLGHQKRIGQP